MRQINKKDLERLYLKRFLEVFDEFIPVSLEDDRERPDFIVHFSNGTIGIELTRLYRPQSDSGVVLQAQESLMYQLMEKALKIYEETHSIPIYVHVLFSESKLVKRDLQEYAKAIADEVTRNIPNEPSGEVILDHDHSSSLAEIGGITDLMIRRFPELDRSIFSPVYAAWCPIVDQEYIQGVLDSKEKCLPGYDPSCTEFCLLVAHGLEGLPARMQFSNEIWTHAFRSSFDQVLILDWHGDVRKLVLQPE